MYSAVTLSLHPHTGQAEKYGWPQRESIHDLYSAERMNFGRF